MGRIGDAWGITEATGFHGQRESDYEFLIKLQALLDFLKQNGLTGFKINGKTYRIEEIEEEQQCTTNSKR